MDKSMPIQGNGETSSTVATALPLPIHLGEELPIFCEKCGYLLHGSPQVRCQICTILQFQCPECGHHQPINTLRPAAQRVLGRMRAWWLGLSVLVRINYFGWLLVAWFAMGEEWHYKPYGYGQNFLMEMVLAFGLFGLLFGMVSRMLLLRWRKSAMVGGTLAVLVIAAVMLGSYVRLQEMTKGGNKVRLTDGFGVALTLGVIGVVVGAMIVWPIWVALAKLFLPARSAKALLDWQQSLSSNSASSLARE